MKELIKLFARFTAQALRDYSACKLNYNGAQRAIAN